MNGQIANSPARVLVAEDNRPLALFLSRILEKHRCDVVVAKDGVEALELFSTQRFDLLVLDGHMPRLGGLDACRQIRERFQSEIPIVLLTSDPDIKKKDAISSGATRLFEKPLYAKDIRNEILSLLEPDPTVEPNTLSRRV